MNYMGFEWETVGPYRVKIDKKVETHGESLGKSTRLMVDFPHLRTRLQEGEQ